MKYFVNEVFLTLQGEGVRAGTPAVFLRLGKCNQKCRIETHGFDCDTEFESGEMFTLEQVVGLVHAANTEGHAPCDWVVVTGGEPALQLDRYLIDALHVAGYRVAVETNGSIELPEGLDWITVSPKVAEHAIRQRKANEVKYVRGHGQFVPSSVVDAEHYLISPRFTGDVIEDRDLAWCINLVKDNPRWRLSCQQHKFWGIR